jgi:hypothetical protein
VLYGPGLALDGLYSDDNETLFKSNVEDYPWIQWKLPSPVSINSIIINFGGSMQDIQIRVGNNSVGTSFRGKINVNTICGKFDGPSKAGEDYTIACKEELLATHVTVQILDDMASLEVNEITIESRALGRFSQVKCKVVDKLVYLTTIILS